MRVDASATLAAAVAARKQTKGIRQDANGNVVAADMKSPTAIDGLPAAFEVRPIEILHAAGRLTIGTDAPVAPIAAIAPILKYGSIFEPCGRYVQLTAEALALRGRLRGALAETLGIGLSDILARAAIRADVGDCAIEIADAEMAVPRRHCGAAAFRW